MSSLRWLSHGEMLTACVVGFVCELRGWSGASSGFHGAYSSEIGSLGLRSQAGFQGFSKWRLGERDGRGCLMPLMLEIRARYIRIHGKQDNHRINERWYTTVSHILISLP